MIKKTAFLVFSLYLTLYVGGQSSYDAILKSRALTSAGEEIKAIGMLTAAISEKEDGLLYAERADACLLAGDYSGAINDFNKANTLITGAGEYGLARIYALKGEAASSLLHLERNLLSGFRRSGKEVLLDPAFAGIENTPEWRQFWKRDWYTELETGVSEIEYYVSSGKKPEAAEKLRELQAIYKGKDEVEYASALVSLSTGKPGEAVTILSAITNGSAGNEKHLRLLAKAQTDASNPAGASATYTRLLNQEVPDAELFLLRAECYRKTGETGRAMADIEKYLSLYPLHKTALRLAGQVSSAAGNNIKALSYFSKNIGNNPGDPDCFIDRANSYMALKSWEPAINDYSMSLDLNPSNPEAWLSKGIALIHSGKTEDACHDFRFALNYGSRRATDYISRYCIK